ncbi:MAG TPA: right-handed parallel beta-helix repeat-containing protein [Pirellulales bacterium]|nr:right-handed parallel beta-helix repeat-containing protein [Pirellulales bacterium]
MKHVVTFLTIVLLHPLATLRAAEDAALTLHFGDGQQETLSRFEELPQALAKITAAGDRRLVVKGQHKLQGAVHLAVSPGQLIIEGTSPDAALDLGELPASEAALCLEVGNFEVRGLTLRNGSAWSVQISQDVRYQLAHLRILDARGGGIVVWGPCGVDREGLVGNRVEHCSIERFNTLKAKWTSDGISVRDNQATIAHNVIRDSATETMGIRAMGAGNRIEANLVQNVGTGDAGGIYLWAGEAIYTAVGSVVRHNIVVGTPRGVYLDDGTCAARVEQNYLIDCREAAIFIGGGRDNVVNENIALGCPILAHIDNRRSGWRDLPEKAVMFSAAGARLQDALRNETLRARIAAGGLDVKGFETLPEATFNQPNDNRVAGNVMMPPGVEIRWQNYARFDEALVGSATDPAMPNRMLSAPSTDWRQLSAKALGISSMPDVAELLSALSAP